MAEERDRFLTLGIETSCDDTAFLKTDGEVYRMNGGVLTKV